MLRNILKFAFLAFFLNACVTNPTIKYDDKEIQVKIDKAKYYKIPSEKQANKKGLDSCVFDSLYLRDKNDKYDFSLDYIDLNERCDWGGFSKSEYLSHIKDSNKIRYLKFAQKFEKENMEITKYQTDKKCGFYLVSIYGAGEVIFIVDKNGALVSDMTKDFDMDMQVDIKNSCSNETLELKHSIIKNNFFYKYFKKEENDKNGILWILEN